MNRTTWSGSVFLAAALLAACHGPLVQGPPPFYGDSGNPNASDGGNATDGGDDGGTPPDSGSAADAGHDAGNPCSACDFGCCTDHCCVPVISNAGDLGGLQKTGLNIGAPSGTFNTSTDCTANSALGACQVVKPDGGIPVCVCRSDTLSIHNLQVGGGPALALLVYQTFTLNGLLDVGGSGTVSGPGQGWHYTGTGSGLGGSYGTVGGNNGGPLLGTPEIIPLVGGCSGEDICSSSPGGGAGGAIQISAGLSLTVDAGAMISSGGGGGVGGGICNISAPGGGSGGSILLEAPTLSLSGTLAANGGGGGGGGALGRSNGGAGYNAVGAGSASGGYGNSGYGCLLCGDTSGGQGGSGSVGDGPGGGGQFGTSITCCLGGPEETGQGGGGGGAGRIRLNSTGGCQCSAVTLSPSATFGTFSAQ
jgi:hypothetical protein